ncbi:MAG: hypothetical protein H8K08_08515 [Nitrospira sp.]|nr:hypothetical protein [Nitrospira sp.]
MLGLPAVSIRPRSVLFVCKGNICRSPFAEHLASNRWPDLEFGSAGIHVRKPAPAPEHAVHAAKRYGLQLEQHRSQAISQVLIERYDMVVAMEVWQYVELRSSFESHQGKMFLLAQFAGNRFERGRGYAAYNIADPYGGQLSEFEQCFERISQCVTSLVAAISA